MFVWANTKQFSSSHRESPLSALHLLFFPPAIVSVWIRAISVSHQHKASEASKIIDFCENRVKIRG